MVVAMACTKNWCHYLAVDIYSLLKTTPAVKKIYLLLETDNIDDIPEIKKVIEKYPVELKIVNFNSIVDDLIEKRNINRDTIFSNFCFARLALPSIVEEDKVLYIDTDAIVLKDIYNIWRYDISNYYIAGCKDYGIIRDGTYRDLGFTGRYVNSGFILMNLKKIREDNLQEKWFKVINEKELKYPDQDALNIVCQDQELYLPTMYNFIRNVTIEPQFKELLKVMHYAGPKEQWVVDKWYHELWYDVEEKFYGEFGE